jgi:hypothetical protein
MAHPDYLPSKPLLVGEDVDGKADGKKRGKRVFLHFAGKVTSANHNEASNRKSK